MPRRIVFPSPREAKLESFELPPVGPRDLLVRTERSLMSTGTEGIAFAQAFDAGTHWDRFVRYPFPPGYAAVGIVESVGDEVQDFAPGDRVFVPGNHASHHVLRARRCAAVPSGIAPEHAAWFALARIAYVGIRAAAVQAGHAILVVGAGPIGQMCVRWAHVSGAHPVVAADPAPERLAHALRGGATAFASRTAPDDIREAMGALPPIVIDATGHADAFAQALSVTGFRGRVVLLGDTGSPANQRLGPEVITRGLTIVGVHAAHLGAWLGGAGVAPFEPAPDEETARAAARANDEASSDVARLFFPLVQDGRFELGGLNTHTFAAADCSAAYELAAERRTETMGVVFSWD